MAGYHIGFGGICPRDGGEFGEKASRGVDHYSRVGHWLSQ